MRHLPNVIEQLLNVSLVDRIVRIEVPKTGCEEARKYFNK
jgi:hypothetical protein